MILKIILSVWIHFQGSQLCQIVFLPPEKIYSKMKVFAPHGSMEANSFHLE